ncbi:hypothetical protein O1L55_10350 [Streptomyces albulus]|nr:hypothetical protein [Streptomyces noursei]
MGLFTCDRPLRAFYESAGWHHLPGTVLVGGTPQAPFPSDRPGFDKVTMADFFSPRARQAGPRSATAASRCTPGTSTRCGDSRPIRRRRGTASSAHASSQLGRTAAVRGPGK